MSAYGAVEMLYNYHYYSNTGSFPCRLPDSSVPALYIIVNKLLRYTITSILTSRGREEERGRKGKGNERGERGGECFPSLPISLF